MIRDGEMVSQQTLDLRFYVQVVVPELMPRGGMVNALDC